MQDSSNTNTIRFKNYKAFAEGEIEFKPITILLGANSAGKSSILNLLMMLEQTFNSEAQLRDALLLNGTRVSLGENLNIIKDKATKNVLEIGFDIDITKFSRPLYNSWLSLWQSLYRALNDMPGIDSSTSYSTTDSKLTKNLRLANTRIPTRYTLPRDAHPSIIEYNNPNSLSLEKSRYESIIGYVQDLGGNLKGKRISVSYLIEYKRKRLRIIGYKLNANEETIVSIDRENGGNYLFSVPGIQWNQRYERTTFPIVFSGFDVDYKSGIQVVKPEIHLAKNLIAAAYETFAIFFNRTSFEYVTPLRATPQRYYFVDESTTNNHLDSEDGAQLAEILKNNKTVASSVNKWLKTFGAQIKVDAIHDVLHTISVAQNGNYLSIKDVGFGISQVLPILVQGFMSKPYSKIIIEQPEIHLHPKMQADLADCFIELTRPQESTGQQRTLIIETHSEYLLKRLRRRIAEGSIDSSEIAIYFIEPRDAENNTASIRKVDIAENGAITWPKAFYETSFEDDMKFLEALTSKKQ